jgi:hypothetical protein
VSKLEFLPLTQEKALSHAFFQAVEHLVLTDAAYDAEGLKREAIA